VSEKLTETERLVKANPAFDKPAAILLRLLMQARDTKAHGKTGVLVHYQAGKMSHLTKVSEMTVK
jgi:hypothetical protein